MSCNIYCDYGTYLKTRATYQAICDLKKLIDDYNLTKGGTICGDLIIKDGNLTVSTGETNLVNLQLIGDLSSNGDIILHDSQIKLMDNGRTTYAQGNTLSILELTPLGFGTTDASSNVDISSIIYSNIDSSNSIFNTTTNRVNVFDFSNVLQDSLVEIYASASLRQGSKDIDYTRIYLEPSGGIGERVYIDSRTVAKDTESTVCYGPVSIVTNVNSFLNHNYYIVAEKKGSGPNTDVSFNAPFRITFRQTCLKY